MTMTHLQFIAQIARRYSSSTHLLKHEKEISEDAMLKRTYSKYNKHVLLLPRDIYHYTWELLDSITSEGISWMAKEHVLSLESIGVEGANY